MKVKIPYGKTELKLDIPDKNILDIVKGEISSEEKDEKDIITKALANPIASSSLSKLARGKRIACILVSDITRPCPSYRFLSYLIDELKKGGIDIIKIVFGLGIHRSHTFEEKLKLAGEYAVKNATVIDSNPDKCRLIGTTSRGTPVEVFEEALDSDLLIATGNIEYHYFAGYSGGAKAVMPGICTRNSIQANHSMMLDDRSVSGNTHDNPIRVDIEEAGKMAGIDFIFNVILDDSKKIIDAVAGANNDAWLEGIKRYDDIYIREVDSPADIVIASPGGHPKDLNLYQSQKALENIKDVAKPGGTIVLIASCHEGFGEDVFEEWMGYVKDYGLIESKLKENFVLGGHKAVAVSRVVAVKKVLLYSEFDYTTTDNMGFEKVDDIQSYLDRRVTEDSRVKITIIPGGRFVRIKERKDKNAKNNQI